MLYDYFYQLKENAATGVDGVTFQQYSKSLEENLDSLLHCIEVESPALLATHNHEPEK